MAMHESKRWKCEQVNVKMKTSSNIRLDWNINMRHNRMQPNENDALSSEYTDNHNKDFVSSAGIR